MTATPTSTPAEPTSRTPSRRGLVIAAVAVVGVATVYLALVAATGDGLPRGAKVLGVDVGGLSEAQATAVLTQQLGPRAAANLTATVGADPVTIVPADAGLGFDPAATVQGYAGRIWSPVTLLTQFTGGPILAPVVTVDETELAADVKAIAVDVDAAPVEPAISFSGASPALSPGTNGKVLDQKASTEAIRAAYLVSTDPVPLPVAEVEPSVSESAAADALTAARTAVSAPVTVKVDTLTATITTVAIAEATTYAVKDGALTPTLDGAVLRAAIAADIATVESPGRDATWTIVGGKPVVVPSKVGRGVNADVLASDVAAVLGETTPEGRTVTAPLGTIEPKLSTEQARALGVVEKLASFTQPFPYAAYRSQNIGQAATYVNGTVLLPGEVFSLNDTIKERTPANGYTVGFVVGPGGVFREDLGGGVSASATTVWTAAFYAGLERVYTQAHSIWIPRYRAGLEATVAWGAFDMKFKNDTAHAVFITTDMRRTSLTVTMWGTKDYDEVRAVSGPRTNVRPFTTLYDTGAECRAQTGQPGFQITVNRVFIKGGKEIRREPIKTTYRPAPTVVCGVKPGASPSPSPSVSSTVPPSGTATPKPTVVSATPAASPSSG